MTSGLLTASFHGSAGRGWVGALCVWLVMSGVTESWLLLTSHKPNEDPSLTNADTSAN